MTSATSSTRLLVLFITFCVIESWNTYLNCSSDTGLYPLRFVGFFPCSDTERSQVVTKDCDTRTAVEHAIALINRDTDLLKCFRIELFPINIQDSEKVSVYVTVCCISSCISCICRVRQNYLRSYTMNTMINPFMALLDLIMLTQQKCLLTFLDVIYLLCRYKKVHQRQLKLYFF